MAATSDAPGARPPGATPPLHGLIEGFYGTPWSWSERIEVCQRCAALGLTTYVYAPKDDPLHRTRWRDPYDDDWYQGLERLLAESPLRAGFAISPGLSMDYADPGDRAALVAKLEPVLERGVSLVCLALDDIEVRPGLGADHAALVRWLADDLAGRADLVLVPTEYTGTAPTPYLEALASEVPDHVPIAWTGPTVIADRITADEARARAEALGGRPPLLWDNYPVNDATMTDRLFLGPLRGRDPQLPAACSGWLANPMVQARASLLPLASIAGFLAGEDPAEAWGRAAGGLRTFAEACDGEHPRALAKRVLDAADHAQRSAAIDAARAWFERAERCEAPGLGDEVGPWLEAVHEEARLALLALRLLEGSAPPTHALLAGAVWQQVRRSAVSVMGSRLSVRPVLAQDEEGRWVVGEGAVAEGANAVDLLVRAAVTARGRL